jgi:hypothetical protein
MKASLDYAEPTTEETLRDDRPPWWLGVGFLLILLLITIVVLSLFTPNEDNPMPKTASTMFLAENFSVGTSEGEPLRFYPNGTNDTALPQEWVNAVRDRTGLNPVGHMVWHYPSGSIFGHPMPTDEEGLMILARLASAIEYQ